MNNFLDLKTFGSWLVLGALGLLFILIVVAQFLEIAERRKMFDESDFEPKDE